MPSSSGIRMSEMISGVSPIWSRTLRPSRPVPASKQLKPCAWSMRARDRRTLGSSSTMRQLAEPATTGLASWASGMRLLPLVGDGCHEHPIANTVSHWTGMSTVEPAAVSSRHGRAADGAAEHAMDRGRIAPTVRLSASACPLTLPHDNTSGPDPPSRSAAGPSRSSGWTPWRGRHRRAAPAVLAADPPGESAAHRGRRHRHRRGHRGAGALAPGSRLAREIAFTPARVLLQDFTGVPAVVDLAAMRDAMADLGGDPGRINPLQPVELVVDHSVQVDAFGTPQAFADQRGARLPAQPASATSSSAGASGRSRTSGWFRPTPASSTR